MKRIADEWNSYRALIPKEASSTQINETQKAFYAGAQACFAQLMLMLDEGKEPTEADLNKVDALFQELQEFNNQMLIQALGGASANIRTH